MYGIYRDEEEQVPTTKTKPTQIHKTKTPPAVRELTPIQEQLADIIGDIILRGGHREEVDTLICVATSHSWKMRFGTDETEDSSATTYTRSCWEEWKRRLIRSWPERDARKKERQAKVNAVTEFIRENVRESLESRFCSFLTEATPEEIRFMDGVLMDHQSMSNHDVNNPELEIGNSFEREISRGVRWVRVPRKYRDKVITFVELLTSQSTPKAVA